MHRTDSLPAPPLAGLTCLPCIIDRKQAEEKQHVAAELPPLRPAVTLINAGPLGPCAPHCYEHITVKVHSPLLPAAGPLPPGLLG